MKGFQEQMCPRCGSVKIKGWKDLSGEQKFLVERLPLSAEFSLEERKQNCWCVKCWYEFVGRAENFA